ncbi:flagellar biosynthetic protein FliR [Telmatospirillum sp.]|uniref:flagellar biosynthetic protein FliR n=1 Tax=Telmatospirillum sp. TaxID=2079197 RepID=UPI00284DD85F|nr:flagellar biosynthetic protein FliR [Telmatospirillum sp.]MDR3438514.1 flagellar biosynthetic protein FliR [Telmatospirillum sp.]
MLKEILSTDVYALILIFARLGAAMMLFPGLSSAAVFTRFRLLLALAIAFLLLPSLAGQLPRMPPDPMSMVLLIGGEVTVGLFFGVLTRVLIMPIDIAGSAVGFAVGLTNMFTNDVVTQEQSQLLTGFLNLIAISVVFVTDTHHLMFQAIVDSYALFLPGQPLPFDDFSQALMRCASDSMMVGFKLAAPLIVFAVTFNSALALLNRLVPQVQVFFVGMPVQILGGMAILAFCLPSIMSWFLRHFSDGLQPFLAPG